MVPDNALSYPDAIFIAVGVYFRVIDTDASARFK